MCLSFVGQVIFGAVMLATLGLTIASMFSPGWRQFTNTTGYTIKDLEKLKIPKEFGIFPFLCKTATGDNDYGGASEKSLDFCKQWFENLPNWEKAVVVFMCLALIAEVVTIAWTLISFCTCCCKTACFRALPVLSLIITVFLAVAIIVFALNNNDVIQIDINNVEEKVKAALKTEIGYSFYMACGALAGAIIDIFVALISLFFAKHCC